MIENNRKLKFIFVHGLSGWGHYDKVNKYFPYWGLSGGSIMKYLRKLGYEVYDASVSPTGSAWDRACELYAQLAGTVVDYGKDHSIRCNHERYGKDFSKEPLISDFLNSKIVLIGHSFGGATIRLFSELLLNGSEKERQCTDENDISLFFKGGNKDLIFSLITLAAPTNGTTSYDLHEDPSFDINSVIIPKKYERLGGMVSKGTKPKVDNRVKEDYASYDMHIDHALALNETIHTFESIYYFSYVNCSSEETESHTYIPNAKITESMFMKSAILMSQYNGVTKGGLVLDESWQPNDGLVNVISAKAPMNSPQKEYDKNEILEKGVWYKMPIIKGDHMYFQGGMTKRVKIKPFYKDLVEYISELYKKDMK